MAISAIAGLVSAIGAGAFGATVFGFTAAFSIAGLAGLGAAFALGAGLSMVSRALAPKPNIGAQMRGITQTSREPAGSRKVVYGKMRVGGQVVFISNSGDDNKYLHMAIAFASHEIQSYDEIWFNDKKVWTSSGGFQDDWGTYVTIDRKFGTDGQAASTDLVNANVLWTTNHKLSGIAYIAFRLEWDTDKFPQGVPNITAVIRGKKVFDPRSNVYAYSDNPALCLRDYMIDQKYGLGEVVANIDSTSLNAAANLCEEQVTLDAGGTQDRYRCNGVIETSNQIRANIEQLLASMGGMLTYSGGKYFIDGAEYKTPTLTFTEADVISDIQTQTKQSRRGVYNGVKGIFVSEEKNYKVLDYPPQISSTYATEDGDPIYLDMALPFVTNNTQAQRLAKIALLKSRQQVVINMTVNLKGLQVKIGDTINVTNDRLNYSSKVFQVIDYSLAIADGGALAVNLACIETASAIYDWTTSDEEDFLSGGELDLYDGRTVANVASITLTEIGLRGPDGTVSSAVELEWPPVTDAFVELYKIRYNKTSTTNYFYASTREPRIYISGLDITSNYDFRVQAQNLIGVSSTGTTLSNQGLSGDTTAPSVPTSTGATGGIQTITAEWSNPSDIDFKHVEVFVNSSNSIPATPTSIVDGEEYVVTGLTGVQTRYFWLKAVDFSGNKSSATSSFSASSQQAGSGDIEDDAVGQDEIADDAVGSEQIEDGAIELAAFASNLSPVQVVTSLPASAAEGDMAYLTTDNKLYRYDGSAWTLAVDGADVTSGTLPASAIVANSITAGQIQAGAISAAEISVTELSAISADIGDITAGTINADVLKIDGVTLDTDGSNQLIIADDGVGTAQIASGAITITEFASGINPVQVVASLPASASEGDMAYLTTDNKLYRYDGSAWIKAVDGADVSTGTLPAASIVANSLTAGQIAAGAISTDELAANAVTAEKILAASITANKISGDISEVFNLGVFIYPQHTVTSSKTTACEFTVPAPDSAIKKYASLVGRFKYAPSADLNDCVLRLQFERKSTGTSSGTSIGTVQGSGSIAPFFHYVEVSGNKSTVIDTFGGLANAQTSPSTIVTPAAVEYQSTTDRTRIIYGNASSGTPSFTSGTIYYNEDRWLSTGTWLVDASGQQFYPIPAIGLATSYTMPLNQALANSSTEENYRLRVDHLNVSTGTLKITSLQTQVILNT